MPRRDGLRIWKILKKIQLRSDHGVEKLKSDHTVEDLRLDHAGRQLSFCHWGRELSSLPLSWIFYHCGSGQIFWVPTSKDELRSKTPRDVLNVGGFVCIVWLQKTFKNCLYPCVKEPKSEVNKTVRTWTTESCQSLPVYLCFAYVYVPLDWYHYHYDYGCGMQHLKLSWDPLKLSSHYFHSVASYWNFFVSSQSIHFPWELNYGFLGCWFAVSHCALNNSMLWHHVYIWSNFGHADSIYIYIYIGR